jgi:anti-sigma regulatory factor (Ser/Thr protein kinase)
MLLGEGDVFSLRLGRSGAAVGLARRRLQRWLERRGVAPTDTREICLACSEACANAIEHAFRPAGSAIELDARLRDGTLELRVRDFGSWDGSRQPPPDRGRGLAIMRSLMDDLHIVRRPNGTEIVMRRSVAHRAAAAPCGAG